MIDFTLYPNMSGILGEKKVAIPDGVIVKWPDGDAMVGNFIHKNGKLSGFVDTKALIANESKTTTIPYDYFEAEMENVREDSVKFNLSDRCKYFTLKLMPKYKGCKTLDDIKSIDENYIENDIVDGAWSKELNDLVGVDNNGFVKNEMFYKCETLTSFNSNLYSLKNGLNMFRECHNLTSFKSDLSHLGNGYCMFMDCSNLDFFECNNLNSLTIGDGMFWGCKNLSTFNYNLYSLIDGQRMFMNCDNLSSFNSDLRTLTEGRGMFQNCSSLTSFTHDLSSLTNGYAMFYYCTKLEKFESNLSSLTNGQQMFQACPLTIFKCSDLSHLTDGFNMFWVCKNMTSFNYDLSSLENGEGMFYCCFNFTSFKSNLKSLTNGTNMFYGCKLNTQSLKNIAETINIVTNTPVIHIGIGNATPSEEENIYLTQIHNKGWQVYVNGNTESNIFNPTALIPIDGEQNLNPIPFWAKPVPSDEESANYVDENDNYYNILGGQFIYVDDPESYGMFMNEEDAAMQMRLIKIEKEEN